MHGGFGQYGRFGNGMSHRGAAKRLHLCSVTGQTAIRGCGRGGNSQECSESDLSADSYCCPHTTMVHACGFRCGFRKVVYFATALQRCGKTTRLPNGVLTLAHSGEWLLRCC
jgi:hypothetical protein